MVMRLAVVVLACLLSVNAFPSLEAGHSFRPRASSGGSSGGSMGGSSGGMGSMNGKPMGVDREMAYDAGDFQVKILGRSGKIAFRPKNAQASPVVISFDSIMELDSQGNVVGRNSTNKHSFNNFARLDFNFSQFKEVTYAGLRAYHVALNASIFDWHDTQFIVDTYIFMENGTITLGAEAQNVTMGMLKFNVDIMNWPFCSTSGITCPDGVASYLQLDVQIFGKKGKPEKKGMKERNRPQKYDVGGGAEILISNMEKLDGNSWTEMPTGYPNVVTRGGRTLFEMRFNRFSSSLLYDPSVIMPAGGDGSGVNTGTALVKVSSAVRLAGVTKATLDEAAFKNGIATLTSVASSAVTIDSVTDVTVRSTHDTTLRATAAQVAFSVLTNSGGSVTSALASSVSLQTALNNAGVATTGVTITSAPSATIVDDGTGAASSLTSLPALFLASLALALAWVC